MCSVQNYKHLILRLDVHLKKADDTTWSEVVIGDTRGQFVIADDQIVPFSMEAEVCHDTLFFLIQHILCICLNKFI